MACSIYIWNAYHGWERIGHLISNTSKKIYLDIMNITTEETQIDNTYIKVYKFFKDCNYGRLLSF